MVNFNYKAVSDTGEKTVGAIEAVDRKAAVSALSQRGQFVTELVEPSPAQGQSAYSRVTADVGILPRFGSKRIAGKDVVAMTAQLSTALQVGLPLLEAMEIIRAQQTKPAMRNMIGSLVSLYLYLVR